MSRRRPPTPPRPEPIARPLPTIRAQLIAAGLLTPRPAAPPAAPCAAEPHGDDQP